jgi:hypothetical protein
MRTRVVSWIVATLAVMGLLAGAYRIVLANEAAMAGPSPGQSATFFGH